MAYGNVYGMKPIPMDGAGRVVLPKQVRSRLNLHAGDLFEAAVNADQITLKVIRPAPAGLSRHGKRLVWDAPGATLSESDIEDAMARGREERDRRASGV